jgi:ATP-binding cassette, subfamily B, bacterial MsbA
VRPYTGRLVLVGIAMVLSGSVALILPSVAGRVVDAALVEKSLDRLKEIILGMLVLFAISAGLGFFVNNLLRVTAAQMLKALRQRLHAHLLTHPPSFFERERVGDLLSRLTSDVGSIGEVLTSHLVGGAQQLLVLVGGLTILLVLHPRLTGWMLLAVPPVVLAAVFFGFRFEKLSKDQQKRHADANVAAEESFAGIRTVKAFVREDVERNRYGELLERVLAMAFRLARVWGAFTAVVTFCTFAALTLVLWFGGKLVILGELTPGQLTSFLIYTGMVGGAIGSVASLYGSLSSAAGATQRVRELLESVPAITDPPDPVPLARPKGSLAFRRVRFRYPGKEDSAPAIDGIDLALAPGEVVALVGPSGGGKSTLVSLLLRFHDPQEGEVRLDEVDVRRYALADLRRAIGLVPQEIFLFGGTVAENIRYGRIDAGDEEVRLAASSAQAHEFIAALPQGYDTLVGERGVRLSTGERQRIALARVFLKDPPVVLLDEATSSLDAQSEHLVQRALGRLFEHRTTLVIAHRLATVRRADRVVLLDRGRIVEQGTHEELLANDGLYRRFCELQLLDTADRERPAWSAGELET